MSRKRSARGSSALEFTLLFPMMVFLFIGTFDWGFYAYALIGAENGLRSAVNYTSTNGTTAADSAQACTYVIEELKGAPNMASVTTCNALPVVVTATARYRSRRQPGNPGGADLSNHPAHSDPGTALRPGHHLSRLPDAHTRLRQCREERGPGEVR